MNVEFSKKKIEDLMEELKDQRPVFNSEDDFKFSLAWLIKEKYKKKVEMRISKNSSILPDLVRINFIHERAMEQHGKPS